jgi:hypothetical protein
MARLRIRLVFNPGRIGSPMDKLGEYASQTERFLRSLTNDLGIDVSKGDWLARNFSNGSVEFDGELATALSDEDAERGREALAAISGDDPLSACSKGLVGYSTVAEFAKIGRPLDPDEKFVIGLYHNGETAPSEWREVDYRKASEIRQLLDAPIVSYGSVQGTIHAWHTGARPGFFQVRELSTGSLIRCVYKNEFHEKVHRATREPYTVVHVYGRIEWDRAANSIIEVQVSDIETAEPLTEAQFDRLFGSIPEFTGPMSTGDYIEWLRGDAE